MVNKKGFTLIEVIVVMGLIGIMAAIAIPSIIAKVPDYKLKGTARDVYSTLQRARTLAVKSNGNSAVIFDTANNKYDLCDDWNTTTSSCDGNLQTVSFDKIGAGIGYGHGSATVSATKPPGALPAGDVSYGGNDVVFGPRGLGDTSGYVYLDHQKNTTTYAIGSLTSGSIRIYKWDGSAWQ